MMMFLIGWLWGWEVWYSLNGQTVFCRMEDDGQDHDDEEEGGHQDQKSLLQQAALFPHASAGVVAYPGGAARYP